METVRVTWNEFSLQSVCQEWGKELRDICLNNTNIISRLIFYLFVLYLFISLSLSLLCAYTQSTLQFTVYFFLTLSPWYLTWPVYVIDAKYMRCNCPHCKREHMELLMNALSISMFTHLSPSKRQIHFICMAIGVCTTVGQVAHNFFFSICKLFYSSVCLILDFSPECKVPYFISHFLNEGLTFHCPIIGKAVEE